MLSGRQFAAQRGHGGAGVQHVGVRVGFEEGGGALPGEVSDARVPFLTAQQQVVRREVFLLPVVPCAQWPAAFQDVQRASGRDVVKAQVAGQVGNQARANGHIWERLPGQGDFLLADLRVCRSFAPAPVLPILGEQQRAVGGRVFLADRAARNAMGQTWEAFFLHRTGHDLGVQIHGAGANLDDYEARDTRTLTPGLAVTVEPGTYPAAPFSAGRGGFGIRSEVDVYLAPGGPEVTTHVQQFPFVLGVGDWATVRARGYGEG